MLTFYELAPSPNNTKVRMALRFKGIPFEVAAVDVADRSALLARSGQEGTPVIEDRGIVLPDSEAILHYLDANYREAPRLYPAEIPGRRACESWRRKLDERVAKHWFPVFLYGIKRRDSLDEEALKRYREGLAWLDEELAERESFAEGPDQAINDLRVAEWATYAFPGEGFIARVRLMYKLRDLFAVPPLPRLQRFLEPWQERLA